jgi:hypothetical protein
MTFRQIPDRHLLVRRRVQHQRRQGAGCMPQGNHSWVRRCRITAVIEAYTMSRGNLSFHAVAFGPSSAILQRMVNLATDIQHRALQDPMRPAIPSSYTTALDSVLTFAGILVGLELTSCFFLDSVGGDVPRHRRLAEKAAWVASQELNLTCPMHDPLLVTKCLPHKQFVLTSVYHIRL